ncbi:MAG: type VI secretion protein [Oscillospiraceae bacterium]|nr:type VI secretion protein [Oscillospiraceae bacterium]
MGKDDLIKKLRQGNFVRANGEVLRMINLLRSKYNKLSGIGRVLAERGIAEDEFVDSVNFLAEEGYIHLREVATKEAASLADSDYADLEAKLTGKGIRLLAGGITDNQIEI